MAEEVPTPVAPEVVAQDAKVVGDDAQPEPREVTVDVVQDSAAAQVSPPREGASDKVQVHEVAVALDEVITDPSSPLAVQVPDAGRGSLDLPIHRLSQGTVEDFFASEAAEADEDEKSDEPATQEPAPSPKADESKS